MFKIKTLVAVAALAVTGTAFAKVGTPTETTTGGEMLFSLFSKSAETTYQFDAGVLFKDFTANVFAQLPESTTPYTLSYTLDAATDTAFASFLAATGNAADISFSYFGGDQSGIKAADRSYMTTVVVGGDVTLVRNDNFNSGMNSIFGNYLGGNGGVNTKMPGTMADNGSAFFTKAEGNGYYYTAGMDTLTNKMPVSNANLISVTADVYHFARSDTSALGFAIETHVGTMSVTKLNDTQWNVAFSTPTPAVPEPSTYAMAVAGLAAVGFAARRRAK